MLPSGTSTDTPSRMWNWPINVWMFRTSRTFLWVAVMEDVVMGGMGVESVVMAFLYFTSVRSPYKSPR